MIIPFAVLSILIGALFIALNEPLAKSNLWLTQKLLKQKVDGADLRRGEIIWIIAGTILMISNALQLSTLLRGAPAQ